MPGRPELWRSMIGRAITAPLTPPRLAWIAVATLLAAVAATPAAAAPVKSGDRRFAFDDAEPRLDPEPGRARLLLVREQIVRKNPMPPERLYLDQRPLGFLPQRSVVAADVDPGFHRLEGVLGCPPLVIECRAGARVLLRLREVIDEHDAVRARWLLDDPDLASDLIAQMELRHATATGRGLAELEQRRRTVSRGLAADSILAPAPGAELVVDEVWFEHPLDPLNLRRDFTTSTGTLVLGADAVDYVMDRRNRGVRVSIPYRDIVGLRFGGTRSATFQPWIDLFYRSEDRTLQASFADSGLDSEAGYNRMFGAIRARWMDAAGGGPAGGAAD